MWMPRSLSVPTRCGSCCDTYCRRCPRRSWVRTTVGLGFTILTAAALGFLGLGAPPDTPEWGRMVADSRDYLPDAWWYALAPGGAIFLLVMGFNLLGDGLRDLLDPRFAQAADTGRDA